MPNGEEYKNITKLYEEALQTKLAPPKKEVASPKKDKTAILKKDLVEEESKVSLKRRVRRSNLTLKLCFWISN